MHSRLTTAAATVAGQPAEGSSDLPQLGLQPLILSRQLPIFSLQGSIRGDDLTDLIRDPAGTCGALSTSTVSRGSCRRRSWHFPLLLSQKNKGRPYHDCSAELPRSIRSLPPRDFVW
jgi:hypothetical protein